MLSLNKILGVRKIIIDLRRAWLNKFWGMHIHPTAQFSLSTRFDMSHPKGVHVGAETYVAFEASILCHDTTRLMWVDTIIGSRCFIGARSIIMPGVEIGDECVVGAGSVVTKSVPPRSLVAGNPAKIVRSDIEVGAYGRFKSVLDKHGLYQPRSDEVKTDKVGAVASHRAENRLGV